MALSTLSPDDPAGFDDEVITTFEIVTISILLINVSSASTITISFGWNVLVQVSMANLIAITSRLEVIMT